MDQFKMKALNLLYVMALSMQMMQGISAAARYQDSRAVALERSIDLGKSQKEATDRDMHDDWDQLRKLKIQFNDSFEELVCTKPDELAVLLAEINRLANEVKLAWDLKQEQLEALKTILVAENYTDTGLATGNDKVADTCKGLDEYIDNANKTAWDEKEEVDKLPKEIEEMQNGVDTKPCPCLWGEWGELGECSTTCGEGERRKTRPVEKNATNNGPECEGPSEDTEPCSNDPCPVDCVWGEWTEWSNCPSGCPEVQNKTRTREKLVKNEYDGLCEGKDFEQKPCSVVEDLKEVISDCKNEKESLKGDLNKAQQDIKDLEQKIKDLADKLDQCPANSQCQKRTQKNDGCNKIKDRRECLTSKDGRDYTSEGTYLRGQNCVWCNGKPCEGRYNNMCEPQKWLDKVGNGTIEYETCLLPSQLTESNCQKRTQKNDGDGCNNIKDRRECLTSLEGRTFTAAGTNLHGQNCVWCNGKSCLGNSEFKNKCEPQEWLDKVGNGKIEYETCLVV